MYLVGDIEKKMDDFRRVTQEMPPKKQEMMPEARAPHRLPHEKTGENDALHEEPTSIPQWRPRCRYGLSRKTTISACV